MPENENITTYPEEPTNPSGYEGFEKSVYYILSLLRYMYYSKVESDNKYVPKSGGTITGSVTIQGNLVVNGQSYSIDTENLKVGDYTITLAKDNEQTLTSMVGMVVPKYDGTNYGFFGWDADGYAYVGDLTNYDGTSAITLANNSSLQRISTIDTTNTVVASNGVIYVYDATSHCFKKPTNDNKYYVIRNGAFVETELFTEQKSKNIDNALYHLGAFDTISGNTITRQTGYLALNGSENWLQQTYGVYLSDALITNEITNIKDNYGINWGTSWSESSNLGYLAGNNPRTLNIQFGTATSDLATWKQYLSQHPLIIEYKLATSYTESIIPNQSLLNLDSNGCNWLQNEWEKGLNLFDYNKTSEDSSHLRFFILDVKENGTYYFSANASVGRVEFYKWSGSGNPTSKFGDYNNVSGQSIQITSIDNSYPYVVVCLSNSGNYSYDFSGYNIMLNSGTHSYPYEPPYGAIVREKDIEPVLLWKNSSPSNAYTSTGSSNVISWNTEFKYLIFAMKYYNDRNGITYIKVKSISSGTNDLGLSNGANYFGRAFVHTSTTSGYFENAYANGSINSGNNVCIPVEIYGTNVL